MDDATGRSCALRPIDLNADFLVDIVRDDMTLFRVRKVSQATVRMTQVGFPEYKRERDKKR